MTKKEATNKHHLLYTRRNWSKDKIAKQLRNDSGLTFDILQDTHNELHEDLTLWGGVPLLEKKSLEQILNDYKKTGTVMGNIAMLLTLASKIQDPNKDRFLEHISNQMFYIKEGLIEISTKRIISIDVGQVSESKLYK